MISYKDPNKRREIIMEHYSNPKNKGSLKGLEVTDIFSNFCVDELHLGLKFESDKIIDAKWDGVGCAVFISSSDILINKLIGLTRKEATKLNNEFKKLINGEKADHVLLEELVIFDNVGKQLNRLHCADIIVKALEKAL